MRKIVLGAAVLAAMMGSGSVNAQIPFAVEGRVDAAFPMGEMKERAENGVGFGAGAAVRVSGNLAVYGSYSRTQFEMSGFDAADQGFAVGLTIAIPSEGAMQPWIGAGMLLHSLDFDDADVHDQEEDPGFELGAGMAIPIAPRVRLTPAVGYRQWKTQYSYLLGGDVLMIEDFPVQYLSAGVGLSFAF